MDKCCRAHTWARFPRLRAHSRCLQVRSLSVRRRICTGPAPRTRRTDTLRGVRRICPSCFPMSALDLAVPPSLDEGQSHVRDQSAPPPPLACSPMFRLRQVLRNELGSTTRVPCLSMRSSTSRNPRRLHLWPSLCNAVSLRQFVGRSNRDLLSEGLRPTSPELRFDASAFLSSSLFN